MEVKQTYCALEEMKRRNGKLIYAASACATIGGCSIVANYFDDNENVRKTKRMAQSIFRITNLVKTAVHMGTDYAYVLYVDNNSSTSNYSKLQKQLSSLQKDQEINTYNKNNANTIEITDKWQNEIASTRKKIDAITETLANLSDDADSSIMSKVHRRNASRLREMCAQNGGLYIKLGQHLAMLDHIFPTEYQEELSHLLSRNPRSSYESVRRIIKTDIGFFPEELFSEFHTTPLASASLAQVHIAIGKDGKKYAVKVQHEGLLESSPVDRTIITHLVDLIPIFFRDFNYAWLAKEMNLNLPLELDFTNERHNLSECARILSKEIKEGSVAVPVAVPELSSHRVLVMSFEDGVYVSDKEGIKRMGLNPADISRTVSEVFCEQIYRHGFVHCGKEVEKINKIYLNIYFYSFTKYLFTQIHTRQIFWFVSILGRKASLKLYC